MATAATHLEIAADLRIRAGKLRHEDGSASKMNEYTGHSIKIVGYEIAAAIHGLTAAFYEIYDKPVRVPIRSDS